MYILLTLKITAAQPPALPEYDTYPVFREVKLQVFLPPVSRVYTTHS